MKSRLLFDRVIRFFRRDDGPTAVEYAVMLALIIVVCLGAVTLLGGNASAIFGKASAATASSSAPTGMAGTSWGDSYGSVSFGSDNKFSYNPKSGAGGGQLSGTLSPTGGNTYNYAITNSSEKGTATVSGSSITFQSGGASRTFTKE